jgi:hypothetical protein
MSTTPVKPIESEDARPPVPSYQRASSHGVIAWSSFFFVLLQSVCTFFAALDGLRVVIGVGALASVVEAGKFWDRFHTDWIRVPMVALALAGSLLNLIILMRVRRLRNRPAAQWRQLPLIPRKRRMERVQLVLSLLTLALIVMEEIGHWHTFHRL